jgi:hypothetical protein
VIGEPGAPLFFFFLLLLLCFNAPDFHEGSRIERITKSMTCWRRRTHQSTLADAQTKQTGGNAESQSGTKDTNYGSRCLCVPCLKRHQLVPSPPDWFKTASSGSVFRTPIFFLRKRLRRYGMSDKITVGGESEGRRDRRGN